MTVPLSKRISYPNIGTPFVFTDYSQKRWNDVLRKVDMYARVYPNMSREDAFIKHTAGWDEEEKRRFIEWQKQMREKSKLPRIASKEIKMNSTIKEAYTRKEDRGFEEWKDLIKRKIREAWEILNELIRLPLIEPGRAEKAKATLHQLDLETDAISLEAELRDRILIAASELKRYTATECASKLEEAVMFKTADVKTELERINRAIDLLSSVIGRMRSYDTVRQLSEVVHVIAQYTDISLDELMKIIEKTISVSSSTSGTLTPLLAQLNYVKSKKEEAIISKPVAASKQRETLEVEG